MAGKAQSIFTDQDFYGAVRFYGSITIKSVSSWLFDDDFYMATGKRFYFGSTGIGIASTLYFTNVSTELHLVTGTNTTVFTGGKHYLTGSWGLINETPSGTNPTIVPLVTDESTGIGSESAGNLSLIAGGLQALKLSKNGTTPTMAQLDFPLISLSGISATPTNLELEGLIGAPDQGAVCIIEDADNARVLLVVRLSTRWRWLAFANTA